MMTRRGANAGAEVLVVSEIAGGATASPAGGNPGADGAAVSGGWVAEPAVAVGPCLGRLAGCGAGVATIASWALGFTSAAAEGALAAAPTLDSGTS